MAKKHDLHAWTETPVIITPPNTTPSCEYDDETGRTMPAFSDLSFRSIGLEPNLVNALQKAFPDVKRPTVVQEKLIKEIIFGGRDILLKDDTGSGKYVAVSSLFFVLGMYSNWILSFIRSFAIVLGLLSKPRVVLEEKGQDGQKVLKRVITSLFIVPHRDLAYQLLHWIERILLQLKPELKLESITQVLVRGSEKTIEETVEEIKVTPPHILICTPQAFLEAYKVDKEALQLERLSTVVVDEVDYLVPTVAKDPKKSYWKAYEKEVRKVRKHPGPTREILDIVYARRKELWEEQQGYNDVPQLILSSATLRAHLKDYLFYESGWLNGLNLVKIGGPAEKKMLRIEHSILVVSDTGVAEGARIAEGKERVREAEEEAEEALDEYYDESKWLSVKEALLPIIIILLEYTATASPFNPISLEAVAAVFGSDVPTAALLVIPSSAPVKRAVYELRGMGVNAHCLDLQHAVGGHRAKPTLLVATVATTRGLDLPSLTHVFVLGLLEGTASTGRGVDSYLHISGRVGRFGRAGKVISIVEGTEAPKVGQILSAIRVQFKESI